MRILFVAVLGTVLFFTRGMAQEDYMGTATSALQDVLSTLKQSVEQLSLDNDHLTARDNEMKQQVSQLQAQLGSMEAQGEMLDKAADQLQGTNPRRAQQIGRLQNEKTEFEDRIQKAQSGITMAQQSMDAGNQEDQKLASQLKSMTEAQMQQPPSPEFQAAVRRQKEKLKLMKMIYDSQQRQASLHQAILEFQKDTPLPAAAGALARQRSLEEELKQMEDQTAQPSTLKPAADLAHSDQWEDAQLGQMEMELKTLEKNYAQLKVLLEQMSQKAKEAPMTVSQRIEEKKLQGHMDDLDREGKELRADLDDLRTQMIDLDKRKSHLETTIQQLP